MPTITNFMVDVVASGVAAPLGPLVRTTDMSTLPTPNQDHTIVFTTALSGVTVSMTYEQLTDSDVRARILSQAGGIETRVADLRTAVAAVYAVSNPMTTPHTYADYVAIIEAIRANITVLNGYY